MKIGSNTFYIGTILTLFISAALWLSCSYEYDDNYSYAKENESYLAAVKDTANFSLLGDQRVKSILGGQDENAKASLQHLLDQLQMLKSEIDGVAYAALLEAVLANDDVTASNIKSTLSTIVTMMEAIAKHDQKSAIAGSLRDDAEANAARAAMSTYTADRSSKNIEALLQAYYNANAKNHSSLASSSAIAFSIIFAGSAQAAAGSDSIDATLASLKHANSSTAGDDATEKQKSGINLISLVIAQAGHVLSTAENAAHDSIFKQAMIHSIAKVVNNAGSGMVQIAAVVASRVEVNMISSGRSSEQIAGTSSILIELFQRRHQIAERARTAASTQNDSDLSNRIAGVVAQLNQVISSISSEAETNKAAESTKTLAESVVQTGVNANTIANSVSNTNAVITDSKFQVSVSVSGLSGILVLRNNNADALSITANGAMVFAGKIANGSAYAVTIATQPTGQTCSVTNGSGTISGKNVAGIAVQCTTVSQPNTYAVGGTISGLSGTVILRNNGADDLTLTANGTFNFATRMANGASYAVTVATQPTGQTCSVTTGSGAISSSNVTGILVQCSSNSPTGTYTVGGTISGLSGSVVLRNNGSNDLTLTTNGAFAFTTSMASGASYAVTVATQPNNQTCSVTNGTGSISGSNVTGISVQCVSSQANTYTVGGTISGLSGTVVLRKNGSDDLTLTANGSFTFATAMANAASYAVTVATQPNNQTCSITSGSGTISSSNITSVSVQCVSVTTYTVGGTISGLSGTVILQNNGGDNLTLTANGSFTFATALNNNASYSVTVSQQPSGQTCSRSNSTGTISSANVTNVSVTCKSPKKLRVSTTTVNGKMNGNPANVTEAMALADAVCVSDFGSGYKAWIASSVRNYTDNDWALAANTEYVRADGTTAIGTTNHTKTFPTLPNGTGITANYLEAWTGMNAGQMLQANRTCNDWQSGSPEIGNYGYSSAAGTANLVASGDVACNTLKYLYCAEQ